MDLIQPENPHYSRTRMVALENTHNRGGGTVQPYACVEAICRWAHENKLTTHLDGARLFNAVVASGIEVTRWTQHFDTVSVCFSKGLGAGRFGTGRTAGVDRRGGPASQGSRRWKCGRRALLPPPHFTPWNTT